MSDIRFGKCDVQVNEVPASDCEECSEPIKGRGFYIELDFRGAGQMVPFGAGIYCSVACAEEDAKRIRATLPECEE